MQINLSEYKHMSLTSKVFSALTIIWVLFWSSLAIIFHEKSILLAYTPFAIGWGIHLCVRKRKKNKDTPSNIQFKISDTLSQAWHMIKGSKWPILAPYLVASGCIFLTGFILGFFGSPYMGSEKLHAFASLSASILLLIFTPLFCGAWMVAIKRVRGETLNARMSFYYNRHWLNIVGSILILSLIIVIIGACLVLIISPILKAFPTPHSHLTVFYVFIPLLTIGTLAFFTIISFMMFTLPLKLDLNLSLWKALNRSFKIVKPYWPEILVLFIVLNLICLILFLFIQIPVVGWVIWIVANIWFIPFYKLSFAVAYSRLSHNQRGQAWGGEN